MDEQELFQRLGLALAIGLLIGAERGWQQREAVDGTRVAGIRTFALMGLLGGLLALLATRAEALLAVGFAAVTALVAVAHTLRMRDGRDAGMTSEVAALITFCLGALAVAGDMVAAAAAGVVTTALLGLKERLHGWIEGLTQIELLAAIKLLLISVVLLPVLPDKGYGPGEVLNPFKLWLAVVLITAVSFLGYFAVKLAGARIGTLLTALFGGVASSTAVTVSLSRRAREAPPLADILTAGVAVAAATSFCRLLVIVGVLSRPMMRGLLLPCAVMAVLSLLIAGYWWWRGRGKQHPGGMELQNPFDIATALKFGAFLAAVMLASEWLREAFGDTGIYVLAAISGLADVDAIAISMVPLAALPESLPVAVAAVVIAVVVNTLVKAAIGLWLGGREIGWRLGVTALVVGGAGMVTALSQVVR